MDADRFDALSRSLTTAGSRRHALTAALGVAVAPLFGGADADAHDLSKKCKKKSGDAKKKCVKKAKKHNAQHASEVSPLPLPPEPPPLLPAPPPLPAPFCTRTGIDPLNCQASGPQCICATSASGAQTCVALASWRENVFQCGACTGPGEICVNPNGAHDFAACAVPCANPR